MRARIVRLTLRLGSIGIFLFFLFLLALPNLVDLDNYRDDIIAALERRYAVNVELRHLRLYIGRTIGIKIVAPRLVGRAGALECDAEAVLVGLDIPALLQKRVKLSVLHFVRPVLRLELARPVPEGSDASPFPAALAPPGRGDSAGSGTITAGECFAVGAGGYLTWCPSFERLRLAVYDGRVTVVDRAFTASPVTTVLDDVELDARLGSGERLAPFELTAKVGKRHAGSLDISGYIGHCGWSVDWAGVVIDCRVRAENLDADAYWPYYARQVPMQKIGGRVDVDATYAGDLAGHFRSRGGITVRGGVLAYRQAFGETVYFDHLRVGYDFELGERYDTIRIDALDLDLDGIRVAGSCRFDDVRAGADGRITARITAGCADLEHLTGLLPWGIMPEFVGSWWRRHRPRGTLVVEEAHLVGSYREIAGIGQKPVPPKLLGARLRLKDAGSYEEPLVPAGRVEFGGMAELVGDRLKLSEIDLRLGFHVRQRWQGEIGDLFRDSRAKLHGELDGRLEEVLPVLRHWRPEFPLLAGLRTASGPLRATVKVHDRLAAAGLDDWRVDCRPAGVSCHHGGIGAPVERLWGEVAVMPGGIAFSSLSGRIAGAPMVLDGSILCGAGIAEMEALSVDLVVASPALTPAAAAALLPKVAAAAPTAAAADFAALPSTCRLRFRGEVGLPESWRLSGRLAVHGWNLRLAGFAPLLEDVSLKADFAGTRVDLRRFVLHRGGSDLSGHGYIALVPPQADFFLDLHSRRWNNADMRGEAAPTKAVSAPPKAAISLPFMVSEHISSPLSTTLAWLGRYCHRGELHWAVDKLELPGEAEESLQLERLKLEAGWNAGELAVRQLVGGWKDADFFLAGRLKALEDGRVHGRFSVYGHQLAWGEVPDTAPSTAPAKRGPGNNPGAAWPADEGAAAAASRGRGRLSDALACLSAANDLEFDVRFDNLRWKTIAARDVTGRLRIAADGVRITDLSCRVWGGDAGFTGFWDRQTAGCRVQLWCDAVDMQAANESLAIYSERQLPLSGRGTVKATLDWLDLPGDGWRSTLDGNVSLVVNEGSVGRFALLANILSLLNVSQLVSLRLPDLSATGLPFTAITGTFAIADGDIRTDDLLLTGPALNLAAAGVISLPRRFVELIIEAQPLQTIDRVLTAIPLLGYVIGGDGKRFIVVRLEVAGPFDQVTVKPVPLEGLTRQTGGIIKRLLETPGRLLGWPGSNDAKASSPPPEVPDAGRR